MWLKRALSYYMEGKHQGCKASKGVCLGAVAGGVIGRCVRVTVRRAGSRLRVKRETGRLSTPDAGERAGR